MRNEYIDTMTHHYAIAALWSSLNWDWINAYENDEETDYTGEHLDADFEIADIDADTYRGMREDCARFVKTAGDELIGDMSPDQCGHDFWLTRNGHGVGFWDRGLGERGDRLSAIARPFGGADLEVGDDGRIHA